MFCCQIDTLVWPNLKYNPKQQIFKFVVSNFIIRTYEQKHVLTVSPNLLAEQWLNNWMINYCMNQDWINLSSCTWLELSTVISGKGAQNLKSTLSSLGIISIAGKLQGLTPTLKDFWQVNQIVERSLSWDHWDPVRPGEPAGEANLIHFSHHTFSFWTHEESLNYSMIPPLLIFKALCRTQSQFWGAPDCPASPWSKPQMLSPWMSSVKERQCLIAWEFDQLPKISLNSGPKLSEGQNDTQISMTDY